MKRKVYEKPTTQVVQLRHKTQMLNASPTSVKATMSNTFTENDWDVE